MAVRSILTWPDPILKVQAEFINIIDESVVSLARDLVDTMNVSFGAGLAATQIGMTRSIAVIRTGYAGLDLPSDPIVEGAVILINPQIEFLGKEKFTWEEACLSIPGYQSPVRRIKKIKLSYVDLTGFFHERVLENEAAGVVQHETDHLYGKLFVDRMRPLNRRRALMSLRRKIQSSHKAQAKFLKMMAAEEDTRDQSHSVIGRPKRKKTVKKQFGKNKKRK